MNKIKVVALASLVSVFGGNVYGTYDLSLKKKKELSVLVSAFLGTASGGAYYSTGKSEVSTKRRTLKDWNRAHPIMTLPGRKISVLNRALFANGSLTANGRKLARAALIGTVVFGVLNLGLDVLFEQFTVKGLIRFVDKSLEKAEGIVLHPHGDRVNTEELKSVTDSLQVSKSVIAEYLEKKSIEEQLEDGYLSDVVKRKDMVDKLLSRLYELENKLLAQA